MRALQAKLGAAMAVALLAGMSGCQPRIEPEQLGRVVYEVPKVPGMEKPYPLPEPETASEEISTPEGGTAQAGE